MEVKMRVLHGPEIGKEYKESTDEPTNILVGREDITCKANWRLSREDRHVSRAHFLLEVRPPNCLLRDPFSLNGTYLHRPGQAEKKVEEVLLKDGDQIRIGRTMLGFEIITETSKKKEILKTPDKTIPEEIEKVEKKEEEKLMCIRCGNPLEAPPSLIGRSFRDLDFMCSKCRKEVEKIREKEYKKIAAKRYYCEGCSKDVSDNANRDGRAAELSDVALYLCKNCADREREKGRERAEKKGKVLPENIVGYLVLDKLGEGGMGIVYKAWHEKTGRIVALKQMKKIENVDNATLLRFQREMSIMQNLIHSNIVRLYEASHYENKPIFISEFAPNGDLLQFVSDEGKPLLSPYEAVNIIADSLIGLHYFHGIEQEDATKKYVHRDIKPENILLKRSNGTYIPKIADFGLSRCYGAHGGTITKTREFAGTHAYMPPEQIRKFKFCKPSTDIFSMGVTLYYLLTGLYPLEDFPPPWKFKKMTLVDYLKLFKRSPVLMMLTDPMIPTHRRRWDLPRELCKVVDKAIEKEPINRYQTAKIFREALLKTIKA